MLRRLGIRWKILAILAVPIAVLTAGALLISLTAVSDSRSTRQVANLINAAEDMRSVVESLQYERYSSVRLLQAPSNSTTTTTIQNELEQSRWLTDESLEALRGHLDVIDFEILDERIYELVEQTVEIHARLTVLRARVDSDSITEGNALSSYNDIIRNDVMLAARLGGLIDQRDPAQFLSAYSTLDLLVEYLQQERNIGESVIRTGARGERTAQEMQTLVALQESLQDDADAELAALDTDARIPSIVSNLPSMRLLVQTGSEDALRRMDVDAWLESVDRVIDNIDPARVEVIEVASERAAQAAADARNQAIFTIGGTSIAVVFSLVLALIVSRGIVIPLRRLTTAAEKVRDDLPRMVEQVATPGVAPDTELEQIPVESRDEIGKLASAFNSVNETTIVVAREQAALRGSIAEMFVNVARRDQVLLNRQLSFITQLERTEEDPAQLEDLFRLDHLATRMRRNAESLLVLAGIDSGRRLRNPMAVSDVVRTASSEIEHYDRIDLVLTADPAVLGHAALTVAHLLAELMENATVFSDPTSRVEVMTALREDGVAISITDDGLGMDAAAVAEANEKIRSSSAGDVIGAQRLGMFVVGRLSMRHDIKVQISSHGEGHGTRVDVLVPMALLDPQSIEQHSDYGQPQPYADQFSDTQNGHLTGPSQSQFQPEVSAGISAAGYQPQTQLPGAGELPGRSAQEQGLPVRGQAADEGLPVRGAASDSGLPVRGATETGLPTRQSPALETPSAGAIAPEAAEPADATERAGLFSGFRSVAANPLESLESVDATALASGQGAEYVPLVTEDRDSDLVGLSRSTSHTAEQPAVSSEIEVPDSEVYEPSDGATEQFADSEAADVPDQIPSITYDNSPGESQGAVGEEQSLDVDGKPQTQIRVYTGAFPTATGEFPTYTGEIPLHTGQTPAYPSRRSRRDARLDDVQPVVSVDHHVEFEPIGLEDDEATAAPQVEEVAQAAQPQVEVEQDAQTGFEEQSVPEAVEAPDAVVNQIPQQQAQSFFPQVDDSAYRPTTGGFPTVATPGVGVVQPQPSGSFNESVLGAEAVEEKPKRKRFGLFGRKQEAQPEPEVRESRFPGGVSFTPEPVEPAQPEVPAVQQSEPQLPQRQGVFQPVIEPEPQPEPHPEPQPEPQQDAQQETRFEPAFEPSFEPPAQSQPVAQPEPQPEAEPQLPKQQTPSWSPTGAAGLASASLPAATPAFTPQTSWAPTSGGGHGALGVEAAEELRRRSAMTSEVLSELSQLSTYQPEAQQEQPAASLAKRVPSEVPKQDDQEKPAQPARRRDASQVRSMLSGFQAGVNRATSAGAADSVQDGEER